MLNLVAVHPVQSDDRGYDSCDSEDIKKASYGTGIIIW